MNPGKHQTLAGAIFLISTSMATTIALKRVNLLHDIENIAYIEGHLIPTENLEARHMTQDVAQRSSGGLSRVSRLLNIYHKVAVELLYPLTKNVAPRNLDGYISDDNCCPDAYLFMLDIPAGFSYTTIDLLASWLHEYLVYHVLFDWLSMTCPEKAPAWMQKALDAEHEIISLVNARSSATIRPMFPV